MKKIFFSAIIIAHSHFLFAGSTRPSLLYNNRQQLIADTNFTITKAQLEKFSAVELAITSNILKTSLYPAPFLENSVGYDAIVSFVLHPDGSMDSIKLEKLTGQSTGFHLTPESAFYRDMVSFPISNNSGKFLKSGFKSTAKTSERYYIPFRFKIGSTEMRKVESGWLLRQEPKANHETQTIIQQGKK
jgi:hypothetical protein